MLCCRVPLAVGLGHVALLEGDDPEVLHRGRDRPAVLAPSRLGQHFLELGARLVGMAGAIHHLAEQKLRVQILERRLGQLLHGELELALGARVVAFLLRDVLPSPRCASPSISLRPARRA
jgi:hypothetical protein